MHTPSDPDNSSSTIWMPPLLITSMQYLDHSYRLYRKNNEIIISTPE